MKQRLFKILQIPILTFNLILFCLFHPKVKVKVIAFHLNLNVNLNFLLNPHQNLVAYFKPFNDFWLWLHFLNSLRDFVKNKMIVNHYPH